MKNREIYLGKRQMHSAFILVHPMGACQEICNILFTERTRVVNFCFLTRFPSNAMIIYIKKMRREGSQLPERPKAESGCHGLQAAVWAGDWPPPLSIVPNARE